LSFVSWDALYDDKHPSARAPRSPVRAQSKNLPDSAPTRAQIPRMLDIVLKRFDAPDECRVFPKGRFDVIRISAMTLGRATYEPGWRWSEHVGAAGGLRLCEVSHLGLVISGRAAVASADGKVEEICAGDIFFVPPGHDSWVLGDEPYVSLHFEGAEHYARER
jgi:hypothetical protein